MTAHPPRVSPALSLALAILAVAVGATAAPSPASENWPAFRGADGSGISDEKGLPLEWSDTSNVLWKVPIEGRGHSSPIVWDDHVFLTTAVEGEVVEGASAPIHYYGDEEFLHPESIGADREHELRTLALSAGGGDLLWSRTAYVGVPWDNRHRRGSYASPTPVTDGELVYAYFGAQGIYAYTFDGELVWEVDLGDISTMGVGIGTSPVLYGDYVIIQADEDAGDDSFIVALDRRTGEPAWRRARPVQLSWSTPVLVEHEDRVELVTSGNELLISYDPATGEELWRIDGLASNAIHVPLFGHGLAVLTSGYPAKVVKAVRLGGSGELGEEHLAWTYDRGTAYVSSNLLYGEHVYLMTDSGIITCLDARTGEVVYEGGRFPTPQSFLASPVAFDGKILFPGLDGDLFVVRAGPEFEVLATNSMGEPIYATPAIAGGRMFIRGERHLFAIGPADATP